MVTKIGIAVGIILSLLLTSCGVAVEIATPMPSPTPHTGFVDPVIWNGDVIRVQATPRIAFTSDSTVAVALFMQDQKEAYVLLNRTLYLPVYYNAIWFEAPQSTAQLTLNVFRRKNATEGWRLSDSDARTLSSVQAPVLVDDGLGVGIYTEEIGEFNVRVEVNTSIRPENGQTITREAANEFSVTVMSSPDEIPTDTDMSSPFGELVTETLLYDYRGWYYGPCAWVDLTKDDASYNGIVDACSASENGDIQGVLEGLERAGEQANWSGIRAVTESMRGLIFSQQGDYNSAILAFKNSSEVAKSADRTFEFTLGLHNLMTTYFIHGDNELAFSLLFPLKELRGQFYDEIGEKLTQANIGFVNQDYGMMDDSYNYFNDKGAPQAGVLGYWLNK